MSAVQCCQGQYFYCPQALLSCKDGVPNLGRCFRMKSDDLIDGCCAVLPGPGIYAFRFCM